MKIIALRENFEVMVDLFPIDYSSGTTSIDLFSKSLTENGFIFKRTQKGWKKERFLIQVSVGTCEVVNRLLNDIN